MPNSAPVRGARAATARMKRVLVVGEVTPELSTIEQDYVKKDPAFRTEHASTMTEICEALERGPWDVLVTRDGAFRRETELAAERDFLLEEFEAGHDFRYLVGSSTPFLRVIEQLREAATGSAPVLLAGEIGTGKELLAWALHAWGGRSERLFVKVNGTANPTLGELQRRVALASGGTLFVRELGLLGHGAQTLVARAAARREVQLVATSSRELAEDGFTVIRIPSLRERRDDIPGLASAFLLRFSRRYGKNVDRIAPGTLRALLRYEWPGNVREMEHVLERAVLLATSNVVGADLLGLDRALRRKPVLREKRSRA